MRWSPPPSASGTSCALASETGGTPPLDRDLLEVELRRFEAERLLATGRADAAMVQLKQLLGMSPDEPLRLRETLESLVTASTIAAAA